MLKGPWGGDHMFFLTDGKMPGGDKVAAGFFSIPWGNPDSLGPCNFADSPEKSATLDLF